MIVELSGKIHAESGKLALSFSLDLGEIRDVVAVPLFITMRDYAMYPLHSEPPN